MDYIPFTVLINESIQMHTLSSTYNAKSVRSVAYLKFALQNKNHIGRVFQATFASIYGGVSFFLAFRLTELRGWPRQRVSS